jgi:hypothetical protein
MFRSPVARRSARHLTGAALALALGLGVPASAMADSGSSSAKAGSAAAPHHLTASHHKAKGKKPSAKQRAHMRKRLEQARRSTPTGRSGFTWVSSQGCAYYDYGWTAVCGDTYLDGSGFWTLQTTWGWTGYDYVLTDYTWTYGL